MAKIQTSASNGGDVSIPLIINSTAETSTDTFPVISPATSSTVWHCASASTALAVRAVNSCADALPAWSATKPSTRRTILLKAADILESRIAEGADLLCKETGTDEGAAKGFVMPIAVNLLRHVAGQIDGVCGRIVDAAGEGESGIVLKEPIGVVLGVIAWNAPPVFTVRAAATAIAAGCTVIIKSSELAPATVNFVAKAFYDAGLPAGVLNVIHARRDAAAEVRWGDKLRDYVGSH
ncbi:hypothetical protein KEM56_006708 [Ascosphaera pollenicola]|nr:hypothetical protein KEM56_006708 [Ascosphaera pollenicola]